MKTDRDFSMEEFITRMNESQGRWFIDNATEQEIKSRLDKNFMLDIEGLKQVVAYRMLLAVNVTMKMMKG